jgi:UTP--glucose-1-phosphate uridylyltransferase
LVPWAIVPTAGSGTRLLPATAVIPKVMLPVGLCPMVHWAVREAALAGAHAVLVVVSPDQPMVREYLEHVTASPSTEPHLAELHRLLAAVELHFVEQPEPMGIGDALIRCKPFTATDPFSVALPDNWFETETPAIAQVASTYERTGMNAIGLTQVRAADASLYGNVGGVELAPVSWPAFRILSLQDKRPGSFDVAPGASVLRGCARYAVDQRFYDALEATGPPAEGEWDDVPAFQLLIETEGLAGHEIAGRHFDVGQEAGYLAAASYLAR